MYVPERRNVVVDIEHVHSDGDEVGLSTRRTCRSCISLIILHVPGLGGTYSNIYDTTIPKLLNITDRQRPFRRHPSQAVPCPRCHLWWVCRCQRWTWTSAVSHSVCTCILALVLYELLLCQTAHLKCCTVLTKKHGKKLKWQWLIWHDIMCQEHCS